ncbi:MAG: arsenite methyltransferase [Dehalococcoidia bacterium]
MERGDIQKIVRDRYGTIAGQESSCCGPSSSCCGSADATQETSGNTVYANDALTAVPEGADLGLGCGNPVALASLKEGETVLDLGSGAGIDCFLAANKVGKIGKVIGMDMAPEMIGKARENAGKGDYTNVEFRLGEIENLPIADSSVDVMISNCVINLSPDKSRVFAEAFRVLKVGGRLMVSGIVLLKELPEAVLNSVDAYVSCVSGAMLKDEYLKPIESAGFRDVTVMDKSTFPIDCLANADMSETEINDIANSIMSMNVAAVKPNSQCC